MRFIAFAVQRGLLKYSPPRPRARPLARGPRECRRHAAVAARGAGGGRGHTAIHRSFQNAERTEEVLVLGCGA